LIAAHCAVNENACVDHLFKGFFDEGVALIFADMRCKVRAYIILVMAAGICRVF
jgi:hypothetical protein